MLVRGMKEVVWTILSPPRERSGMSTDADSSSVLEVDLRVSEGTYVTADGSRERGELDLSVEWEAIGPPEERGSGGSVPPTDPAAFLGTFRTARATGRFAGIELGYGFETRGEASSDLGFAELGFERNGVLLA
jgi:hypothetical protein